MILLIIIWDSKKIKFIYGHNILLQYYCIADFAIIKIDEWKVIDCSCSFIISIAIWYEAKL